MAWRVLWFRRLRRASSCVLSHSCHPTLSPLPYFSLRYILLPYLKSSNSVESRNRSFISRDFSHGSVNLVLSDGKPKFETHEVDAPKKEKWKTKKRLKMQRKREKRKRKEANRRDPRCIRVRGQKTKQKFPNAEARIKYKIEKAKIKEALLEEKLKKYEVPRVHGPSLKADTLTGEERFYLKKMAQKMSNYVPIGRRGIFGGVVLNMHLHWKKHETVKVICKPCKPGQIQAYAKELARLSGGLPIEIIGNDTIVFYRGINYVQPEVMSPIDTLSKKRALEKSKYEQSLDSVKRFIAIAEKELELYYRHVALYGDPNARNSDFVYSSERKYLPRREKKESAPCCSKTVLEGPLGVSSSSYEYFRGNEAYSDEQYLSGTGLDSNDGNHSGTETDSNDQRQSGCEVDFYDEFGEF